MMLPLFRQFFHDLLYSQEKATLWLRAAWFTGWQVVAILAARSDLPLPSSWAPWLAVLSGVALLFKAGDKNPAA